MSAKFTLKNLIQNLPQQGRVEWIGEQPDNKAPLQIVDTVRALAKGLERDHSEINIIKLLQGTDFDGTFSLFQAFNGYGCLI